MEVARNLRGKNVIFQSKVCGDRRFAEDVLIRRSEIELIEASHRLKQQAHQARALGAMPVFDAYVTTFTADWLKLTEKKEE